MDAAESLSIVDWKLLTDVRLLGLAESLQDTAREDKQREKEEGKQRVIRAEGEKLHLVHGSPQVQSLNATNN